MTRVVALISEHASPLAILGGTDAGGQNVYVAQVARHLAAAGDFVDIYTRRDDPALPTTVDWSPGVRVINVPAGPATRLPKERLLEHMPAFFRWMAQHWAAHDLRYDLVHANFFMSGQVAAELRRVSGVPFVVTFHALGKVRRLHQGAADTFPPEREHIETAVMTEADRIIAECPQDEDDLIRLYGADPAGSRSSHVASTRPNSRRATKRWHVVDSDSRSMSRSSSSWGGSSPGRGSTRSSRPSPFSSATLGQGAA